MLTIMVLTTEKVFIAKFYLFYITVWHIAYECWVCVNNYGSNDRGEGFNRRALFPVLRSWASEWTEHAPF